MPELTHTKDDFHRERSRFLDAFASLEELLLRLPKATKDKALEEELKKLRAIRNDLVHSQFRFVQFDGRLHALTVNAMACRDVARAARLLKLDDFGELARLIDKTKQGFEKAA
ncbi:MAG: hypothetical protein ACKOVA_18200 [Novosphingobium sp.]